MSLDQTRQYTEETFPVIESQTLRAKRGKWCSSYRLERLGRSGWSFYYAGVPSSFSLLDSRPHSLESYTNTAKAFSLCMLSLGVVCGSAWVSVFYLLFGGGLW